jgi:hypothetical protein
MMRGDSLRDFYAKSLALLGLAFLGALGAAVDYWPTNLAIPRISEVDFQIATLRPLSTVPQPATLVAVGRHVAPRAIVSMTPTPTSPAIGETIATNVSEPQAAEARTPDLEFAPPVAFGGLSASAIDLTAPEQTSAVSVIADATPSLTIPVQKSGMLSGFVSSLSDSGSKAGSAIANGFQAFGGAVGGGLRKLIPFGRRDDHQREMIRPVFTNASTSARGTLQ